MKPFMLASAIFAVCIAGCTGEAAKAKAKAEAAKAAQPNAEAELARLRGAAEPPLHPERSLVVKEQGFFPVALRLADGRIAVILRGGAPNAGLGGRLDIVFSSDEGKTWTKPLVVTKSAVDDRNPAFGQAKDGALIVGFYRTAQYDDQGRYNEKLNKPVNTWVTRSTDGEKWSPPAEIDVSDITLGCPYGRIVTLPDGTLLMAVYGGPVRELKEKPASHSYLYRSTDHGKSWKRFAHIGSRGLNETAVLRHSSGKLLAALRSDRPRAVWVSESSDDGKTWSDPRRLTPAEVYPADLIELPDGRVLLTVGDRTNPFGVRGLVSDAKGNFDWQQNFTLVKDCDSDCGYPSSVILKDAKVLTVFYSAASLGKDKNRTYCGAVRFGVGPIPKK
jgi:hypothetical protein